MRTLRRILQAVLVVFCLLLALGLLKSPQENLGVGLSLLALFTFFILLLGPLWPKPKKEKPTRPNTENLKLIGPLSAYPTFLVILAIPFFYFAWDTYFNPRNSYKKILAVAFEIFGNMGVVVLNLALGVSLLVGAVLVYRHLKPIYKRLRGT